MRAPGNKDFAEAKKRVQPRRWPRGFCTPAEIITRRWGAWGAGVFSSATRPARNLVPKPCRTRHHRSKHAFLGAELSFALIIMKKAGSSAYGMDRHPSTCICWTAYGLVPTGRGQRVFSEYPDGGKYLRSRNPGPVAGRPRYRCAPIDVQDHNAQPRARTEGLNDRIPTT